MAELNEDIFIVILGEKVRKLGALSGGREVEMCIRKAKGGTCMKFPRTEPRLNDLVQERGSRDTSM